MTTLAQVPKTFGPSALRVIKDSCKALRELKKVDPRERYVLLFPDSESAHVGMAFKLLTNKHAEQVFEQASEYVKKDLLKLCLDGPRSDLLNSIQNRHLATFVTTHATIAKLANERPNVIPISKCAGGIGIGFMNSLVFSGAMTFENALDYINRQAQALEKTASIVPTARVKVRFLPATSKYVVCGAAIEHCKKKGIPEEIAKCSVVKQSYAHVLEIAGHEEAIRYLETEGLRLFRFRFISRVAKTSSAYHTELMKPVSDFVKLLIEQKMNEDPDYIKDPETCSVHSSIAGRRLRVVKYIKRDLINYPVSPVKTEQTLHVMFKRPASLPQPNIIVLWSGRLLNDLKMVNFRAWRQSSVFT